MGIAENWLWISPKDIELYLYSKFQLCSLRMILFLALSFHLIFIYEFISPTQTRVTGGSCSIFKPFFMHPFGSFQGLFHAALEIGELLTIPTLLTTPNSC